MAEEQAPRRLGGYRIIAKLGAGGMANVYLGMQSGMAKFKKLVVVKLLHEKFVANPEFLDMFLAEARLAARLNHPNVVNTYEVGEDDGRHFMAMEYLEGQPYSSIIKRVKRQHLALEHSLKVLVDVLSGLHYAHELRDFDGTPLGVVHRDVSPQNIFVTYDGNVKLVDFGVAKAACSDQETRAGVIKGKIAYLAPEQAGTQPVDRRADIFTVGVLMWEAMAQKRFSSGSIDVATIHKRVTGGEPRIREIVPDAPAELADICDRAIALAPEDRYATALDMKTDLESFLEARRQRSKAHSLAVLISESFAEERSTIQTVIEQHARLDSSIPPADGGGIPTINLRNGSGETSNTGASFTNGSVGSAGSAGSVGSVGGTEVPSKRTAPAPWIALAAVIAVAGVGGAYLLARDGGGTDASAAAASSATASVVAPNGSAARDRVELIILTSPPEAVITLDGAKVSGNPFRAQVERGPGMHRIRATAKGFEAEDKVVVFDQNVTVKLTLKPLDAGDGGEEPDDTGRKAPPRIAAIPAPGPSANKGTETAKSAADEPSGPPKAGDRLTSDRDPGIPSRTIDDEDPYAP